MADGPLVRYLKSTNQDLDIIRRAIAGGWDISDGKRAEIVEELMDMVRSPNRVVAVKAARILEAAVANDRRYELSVLAMLQKDQEDHVESVSDTIDGEVKQRLEKMTTADVHDLLEKQTHITDQTTN